MLRTESVACTRALRVETTSFYVPRRSQPHKHEFYFAYTICVTNEGDRPVRLVGRRWKITNAIGMVERVLGDGVVGQTPLIEPGSHFEYTSACPIDTRFGAMEGGYRCEIGRDERFEAEIAPFLLVAPHVLQ